MNIYTDYELLNIETITKISETINNDFNLLGKNYNKIEKYVDSKNIFNFNIDFLLNKEEKYNLYKQVSKDYFWVEFLLELFETEVPLEIDANTIKVKKNNLLLDTNNDIYIKIKDENNIVGISKIISIDNNDTNFTILELENDISTLNYDVNKNYFLNLVKLCYLDQKGIQFNMINEDLYKARIKAKTTIGVIANIDIFPSPVIETIDLETYEKPIFIGDRILTGRFTEYSLSDTYKYTFKEGYTIKSKSIEFNDYILTLTPKSFIIGTDLNINVRIITYDKISGIEFSEVIFNDFLPYSEVYGEKIQTFHVYTDNINIYLLIRINNKVLISQLDLKGVLIKNYYFNTNIQDYIDLFTEKEKYTDEYGNLSDLYLLYKDKQEEHESLIIENGIPVLYKVFFNKKLKYSFNLDNSTYSVQEKDIKLLFMQNRTRFFNNQTFTRNGESFTAQFYTGLYTSQYYLRVYRNSNYEILFDTLIYNSETEGYGLLYNSYMTGNIKIFTENNDLYILMHNLKNSSQSSYMSLKISEIFNRNLPTTHSKTFETISNNYDIFSNRIFNINNVKYKIGVKHKTQVNYDDYTYLKKIEFEKSELDGTNKFSFLIDTELDNITYTETDPIESAYVQDSNLGTGNLTTPTINLALCYTYDTNIHIINDTYILFIVPLMKNLENYTFLYVKTDLNLNIIKKEYI